MWTVGKMRRRRRALSYILSVVIMILITTSLATVVLLWGLNEVSTSRASFSSSIRARTERVQERFVVEDVYYDTVNSRLVVYVRNTGGIQIVVDQVYVDHVAYTTAKTSLGVQEMKPVYVTGGVPSSGTRTVNVATTRGSTVADYWTY